MSGVIKRLDSKSRFAWCVCVLGGVGGLHAMPRQGAKGQQADGPVTNQITGCMRKTLVRLLPPGRKATSTSSRHVRHVYDCVLPLVLTASNRYFFPTPGSFLRPEPQ